jgi:hypothetical protein
MVGKYSDWKALRWRRRWLRGHPGSFVPATSANAGDLAMFEAKARAGGSVMLPASRLLRSMKIETGAERGLQLEF